MDAQYRSMADTAPLGETQGSLAYVLFTRLFPLILAP